MGAHENPPAFPCSPGDVPFWNEGMDLRDWFASQAPISLADAKASCSDRMFIDVAADRAFLFKVLSTLRYDYADAMLAERAKQAVAPTGMQHVAYFDEGEFHWMSGIKPRACELYAEPAKGGAK